MLQPSRFLVAAFLAFLLFEPLAHAQGPSFSVGTASAAPGQKSNGYLAVPAGVDAATNLPVVVINGAKPGPVLALVTGAHGTEYVSIIAVENSSICSIPLKFPVRSSSCRWSTFSRSNKKSRTSILSTTKA